VDGNAYAQTKSGFRYLATDLHVTNSEAHGNPGNQFAIPALIDDGRGRQRAKLLGTPPYGGSKTQEYFRIEPGG